MRLLRYLLVLALFHCSAASAATYAWYSDYYQLSAPSPLGLCIKMNSNNAADVTVVLTSTGLEGTCYYKGQHFYGNYIQRTGDSCAIGGTYNAQTGICDYPACPVGQARNESGTCVPKPCTQDNSGSEIVWSDGQAKCTKYYNLKDGELCQFLGARNIPSVQDHNYNSTDPNGATQSTDPANKCGMNMASKKCTTKTDGTHKCVGRGTYNGSFNPNGTKEPPGSCPNGATNCTTEPPKNEPADPMPENTKDEKPCNYVSVNGSLQCTSQKTENNEGTKQCGVFQGVWSCYAKPPSSNGIVINTKVDTKSNPDGTTTTTKTDTATQTTCKNISDCVTKTTTNTTTVIKDSNGNTTSMTGSCKGDNCPDTNTNPDGDGDGFGDCVGDDCGENGGGAGPTDAELEDVPTFGESAEAFLQRVGNAPIPTAISHLRAPSGGQCPRYEVDTDFLGVVKYEAHCELIEDKRSLIRLIAKTLWALLALFVFLG